MPTRVVLTDEECDSLVAALPESLQPVGAMLKLPVPRSVIEGDPLTPYGHDVLYPICRAVQSIIGKRLDDYQDAAAKAPED